MIPLVIVSNNSVPAIRLYLDDHGLTRYVRGIVGRSFARPDLMKPDPSLLIRGIELIGSRSGGCVIIGDSVADITAARRA
jgi:HAD superfamily hydrolase (TIGR01549 family)